ncbi:MAG: hypothetical protein GIKADHBN_01004 [Phycisphaerales bacterium]|nr:hypothetical protein [Phycisphaerales bacterium]
MRGPGSRSFFNEQTRERPIPRHTETKVDAMLSSASSRQSPGLFDDADSNGGEFSHSQILDHILAINPTATWLVGETFDRMQLWHYLQHLLIAQGPRGPASAWVRPADSPGITAREAD